MIQAVRFSLKLYLFCVLSLVTSLASASTLTLSGNLHFPGLDGSAQDADGLADGTFSVDGDLVLEGTIHCNDDAPQSPVAGACPIRIAVSGSVELEAGSAIYAENRRSLGDGGAIRLDVGGDLILRGPDGSLPGSVVSTSRTTLTPGNAGSLTAVVGGTLDLQSGSTLAANTQSGIAGAISVMGDTVRVAGLVASGPSRTVLATRFSGEALAGGILGQTGGTIHLRALGSSSPGLRIETGGTVVSQGAGSGRLILLEACGIEVRGLIASLSRNSGPSQVVLRSGRGILVDGQNLGSAAPAAGRFGRIRADGTLLGAAGYLVDLFAESDLQILGPDPAATGLFAVTSSPGDLPLRDAGGTITAISLAGALTATGNAFEAGRDNLGNQGGSVDLQAQNDVTLDDATVRAVGGFTGVGGHVDVRSFQGAVSWTFGRGDVRPTGTLVLPARRGTIQITACLSVDITGSQFPINGSSVAPFPGENEGVCAPATPSLPSGEPPLPTCVTNLPPEPSGGPFSVPEGSANGTVVGTVSANDPDAGQSHTFSIIGGNTDGAFAIDNAGAITVANSAALDPMVNPTFNLTVEVTDNGTPVLSGSTTVTINVQNVPEQPVAVDEGTPDSPYVETVGNTILEVTGAPGLTGPKVAFDGNLLANDSDPDGPTTFLLTLESASAGAVVSLNPDGTFTYLPPPGFTGVDSFTYRITDPDGLFDTATVYINVEHLVWYVKNDAAADGLGRSTDPFDTLEEAEAASAEGDTIYLFAGDGTTLGHSDGITLKNGQRLIGQAVQLAAPTEVNINGVDGPVLHATIGNHPKIENDDTPDAAGEDNGVSVAATAGNLTGIEIRGLDIAGFDNAIDVTAAGANNADVVIRDNVISSAGLEGIDVNGGSTGAVTLAIHDNLLTAAGTALDVQRTAGTVYITALDDNAVSGNAAGVGMSIDGVIFDATPGGLFDVVNGGATVIGSPGDGVGQSGMVLTSAQGSLSFSDLDIFADGGAGLQASGAGSGMTLSVVPGVGIIEATGGPAVDISDTTVDLQLSSLKSVNTPSRGVSLANVSDGTTNAVFAAGFGSSITTTAGSTGPAFNVSGGNASITYAGAITNNGNGRAVSIDGWSGDDSEDDLLISGAVDENGAGILINGNGGSRAIIFSGGLDIDTISGEGFAATGNSNALGLHITGNANEINSTSATALRITGTTIGSSNLNFRSVSSGNNTAAADPVNGIVLNATGTLGRVIITGSGSSGQGGNGTGGLIQNITGHGISLTDTMAPSFTNMSIQGTGGSGINGTLVAGFTFDNGTINDTGTAGGADDSNISFNDSSANANVSGVVTVTDSVLTNSRFHGVDIQHYNGTIAHADIQNNVLTSAASGGSSLGSAIRLDAYGAAGTVGNVTRATINNNVIANFPNGAGIRAFGGNSSGSGPAGTFGVAGSGTDVIAITNNLMNGGTLGVGNQPDRFFTGGVIGSGQGNFDISGNGSPAIPIINIDGVVIELNQLGAGSMTATVNNNRIVANNAVGSAGINVGCDADATAAPDNAAVSATISENNVSDTDGPGIFAIARGSGCSLIARIVDNTVAAPDTTTAARAGIRVDSGSATGNTALCLEISGNTTAGSTSTATGTTSPGINLRKQGTNATVNIFGIEGLSPSPTGTPSVENHVNGLNTSSSGTFGVNGTALLSATTGFTSCVAP